MRIKLFETFHEGPELIGSFEEAENQLSAKNGIVLSGITGDITHIEQAIKNIPHDKAYVLITKQTGLRASEWKSDVFLVGGKKDGEMTIAQYFDEEWTDPAGGTHRGNDGDPAAAYESVENRIVLDITNFKDLIDGKEVVTTGSQGNARIILQDFGPELFRAMRDWIQNIGMK